MNIGTAPYFTETVRQYIYDKYGESVLYSGGLKVYTSLDSRLQAAAEKGLYHDTYARTNAGEYWAEIAQAYFDCNRVNNWNHGPVGTREQLKIYDPSG